MEAILVIKITDTILYFPLPGRQISSLSFASRTGLTGFSSSKGSSRSDSVYRFVRTGNRKCDCLCGRF